MLLLPVDIVAMPALLWITKHQLRFHLGCKDQAVKLCITSWFGTNFPTTIAIKTVDLYFIVAMKNKDVRRIEQWLVNES